jgi:hypothetical protein
VPSGSNGGAGGGGDAGALRALFDHHFGLSEDVEHDRVLPAESARGGGEVVAAAAAAEFDYVLVVRARVQWDGDGGEAAAAAPVAEKRIVFGDEVAQMHVLAKLIVETIQVNRLRVW